MVRRQLSDIDNIVVTAGAGGTPVYIKADFSFGLLD